MAFPVRTTKSHVFLSHVREDAKRVQRLAIDLAKYGIATWIDRQKIRPGERWEKAIKDAIRSGDFFVACFSQAYTGKARSYMNEELLLAVKEIRLRPTDTRWFVPLRLNKCELPDLVIAPGISLHSFQYVDIFPNRVKGIELLAQSISPTSVVGPLYVTPQSIKMGPIRHSALPQQLIVRIKRFKKILGECDRASIKVTIDGFRRDKNPEHEIIVWEKIALNFQKIIERNPNLSTEEKKKIYASLLEASLEMDPLKVEVI